MVQSIVSEYEKTCTVLARKEVNAGVPFAQDQYQFIYACVSQFINDRASKRLSLGDAAIRKASSQCKLETDKMRIPYCILQENVSAMNERLKQPTAFQIRRAQQVAGM